MHSATPFRWFAVWGALFALLLAVPPLPAQDGNSRPEVKIVSIGDTIRLQMRSRKPIKSVDNPKDSVITIRTVVGDPTTVRITSQQPDVTTIEMTDIDGGKETYEVIAKLDVEYLKTQIQRVVPTANVIPIPSANNAVILTGTVTRAEDAGSIRDIARALGGVQVVDAMRVGGIQQVQLDLVAVSLHPTLGKLALASLTNQFPVANGTGLFPPGNPDHSPFLFALTSRSQDLLAELATLKSFGLARFLTQPSLVTLSGRPATCQVGGQQAVPVVGGIGGATGVNFVPIGTQLTFLPVVLGNGKIYMEVAPTITELDPTFGTVLADNVVPGRRSESINTTVVLEPGQTFITTNLTRQVTVSNSWSLPFIGPLFGSGTTTEEMIILMTPHLVEPQDCDQLPTTHPENEPVSAQPAVHYLPAYKNSPSLEVLPCAAVEPMPVPEAAPPPARDKLDRVLDKLEQIEKRLDAMQQPQEEKPLPQADSKQGPQTSNYKTIRVPLFKNRTSSRGLEDTLTQEVGKQIERLSPYKVVSGENADLELTGKIISFEENVDLGLPCHGGCIPIRDCSMVVEWLLRDLRTGKFLFDQPLTLRITESTQPDLVLWSNAAMDRLTRNTATQIVNVLAVPWSKAEKTPSSSAVPGTRLFRDFTNDSNRIYTVAQSVLTRLKLPVLRRRIQRDPDKVALEVRLSNGNPLKIDLALKGTDSSKEEVTRIAVRLASSSDEESGVRLLDAIDQTLAEEEKPSDSGVVGGAVMGGVLGTLLGAAAGRPLEGAAIGAAAGNRKEEPTCSAEIMRQLCEFELTEIARMAQTGVSEALIIGHIQKCGVIFNLSGDQILWLKQQGVSESVILAMAATAQ